MALYRLVAGAVVLACMAAAVAVMMTVWALVILVGLLHPRLSPRRACDWALEFIRQSVALVHALRG